MEILEQKQAINKRKKKIRVAYFLWFFFSWMGLHQLYLKNPLKCWAFILTQGSAIICGAVSVFRLFAAFSSRSATYGYSAEALALKAEVNQWLMVAALLGILGFIFWVWDAFTMAKQVDSADKKKWTAFQSFSIFIICILIIACILFIIFLETHTL